MVYLYNHLCVCVFALVLVPVVDTWFKKPTTFGFEEKDKWLGERGGGGGGL